MIASVDDIKLLITEIDDEGKHYRILAAAVFPEGGVFVPIKTGGII